MSGVWSLNATLPDHAAAPCDVRFHAHGPERGIVSAVFRGDRLDVAGKVQELLNAPIEAEAKKLATKIAERRALVEATAHLTRARTDLETLRKRAQEIEAKKADPTIWKQADAANVLVDCDKQLAALAEQVTKQQAAIEHAQQHANRAKAAFDAAATALAERLAADVRAKIVACRRELVAELAEAVSAVLTGLAAAETALLAANDVAGLTQRALAILRQE